ncbi:hypothetical protein [Streptomyces luteireticuli]|uniref:hypothetical protein n=1 Tax=Streptomyces luteireticuli TaxID=173858 RepID=UPI0035575CF6
MGQDMMRRLAAVAASAVLLSGAAAMAGGQAFAAPAGGHPVKADHVHVVEKHDHKKADPKKAERREWDRGMDKKKDKWDHKHHCWTRWDAQSRGYAKWDEARHCWTRAYHGHLQKWDTKHHCWK